MASGDEVRLLGSPGPPEPVASGVVQAASTVIDGLGLIEVDVAVPGGGVLVNDAAEVIGLVNHTLTTGGAEPHAGLAIPSNLATRVAEQLIVDGQVAHPYLGVVLDDADGGAIVQQVVVVTLGRTPSG